MKKMGRISTFAPALGAALALGTVAGCSDTTVEEDAILILSNESSFDIIEVRMAGSLDPTFGPDLLGPVPLLPGEELEVVDIPCDFYDVLIVDELGAECLVGDVNLCFNVVSLVIDDFFLSECLLPANDEDARRGRQGPKRSTP
jgi:hypothetical protein